MHIAEIIKSIDKDISHTEFKTVELLAQKNKYLAIQDEYPNAVIHGKTVCVDNIWENISCMRIKPTLKKYDMWVERHIVIQFPVSNGGKIPGVRIFAGQYVSTIATIQFDFSASPFKAELKILDYSSLIPDVCINKQKFINRIRKYLFNQITKYGYKISNAWYDLATFEKWSMLQ